MNEEQKRLNKSKSPKSPWRKWGPYVSERQWGTVREDYSEDGEPWLYSSHDQARSKTYRWGEEGIAGISDNNQHLCFSVSFWNGKDPILKEILYGLGGFEGNHGEDVKEYYYYLDNVPTHSYMKMLYKYPQNEFPYSHLYAENKKRGKYKSEYELIDTGIFDEDEYFDIFIEYAKAEPNDILIKISVHNRSKNDSQISLLPQIWFRNTWAWGYDDYKPELKQSNKNFIEINHKELGNYKLYYKGNAETLFCENETNVKRLYKVENKNEFFKDGINDFIVNGKQDAVNKDKKGTKAAVHYKLEIKAGKSKSVFIKIN